jgi:hypothetical protein
MKDYVTENNHELLRDDHNPFKDRFTQWCDTNHVLVVDEGLRVFRRQQCANLRSVTITSGLGNLIPRQVFPSLPFLLKFSSDLYPASVRPTALFFKQELAICQTRQVKFIVVYYETMKRKLI